MNIVTDNQNQVFQGTVLMNFCIMTSIIKMMACVRLNTDLPSCVFRKRCRQTQSSFKLTDRESLKTKPHQHRTLLKSYGGKTTRMHQEKQWCYYMHHCMLLLFKCEYENIKYKSICMLKYTLQFDI